MDEQHPLSVHDFIMRLVQKLGELYWFKMCSYIKSDNIDTEGLTGFLIVPETLVFSIGRTHIAMEYYGNEKFNRASIDGIGKLNIVIHDYSKDSEDNIEFFDKVIGVKYTSTAGPDYKLPLFAINEGLVIPTNDGADKLHELGWNYDAQDSIIGLNTSGVFVPEGQFARLVNCTFFDCGDSGLITRRIKMLDFIPVQYDDTTSSVHDHFNVDLRYYAENWYNDLFFTYPIPNDFKYKRLQLINRFVEFIGDTNNDEPAITSYLNRPEFKFILCMAFLAKDIYHQLKCEWQSEQRDDIIPDFFVARQNGFSDIVEFKLPQIKGSIVVGKSNRQKFSAEIQSYIAQTRVYRNYFDDPNNREWFQRKYDLKVYKPRRYLVVGRRWQFDSDVWMEIKAEYQDFDIMTYDDLIDGVVSQFYI